MAANAAAAEYLPGVPVSKGIASARSITLNWKAVLGVTEFTVTLLAVFSPVQIRFVAAERRRLLFDQQFVSVASMAHDSDVRVESGRDVLVRLANGFPADQMQSVDVLRAYFCARRRNPGPGSRTSGWRGGHPDRRAAAAASENPVILPLPASLPRPRTCGMRRVSRAAIFHGASPVSTHPYEKGDNSGYCSAACKKSLTKRPRMSGRQSRWSKDRVEPLSAILLKANRYVVNCRSMVRAAAVRKHRGFSGHDGKEGGNIEWNFARL